MGERMTWEDLVKTYPNSWVVLDDVSFEDGEHCMLVESGIFIEVISIEDAAVMWGDLQNSGSRAVIAYTGDRHVRAITSPCQRMLWADITKEFPDMWVVLRDAEHVDNDEMNPNIVSGIVMCSASDEQIDGFWAFVRRLRLNYYVTRTSDNFPVAFVGVTI